MIFGTPKKFPIFLSAIPMCCVFCPGHAPACALLASGVTACPKDKTGDTGSGWQVDATMDTKW